MFQRAWDPTSRPHLRQHLARAVRRAHDELETPCRHVVPEPQSWRFRRPERIGSNLPNNVSLVNPPRIIVWAAFSTYILEICRINSRVFTNLVLLHCFPSRFDHHEHPKLKSYETSHSLGDNRVSLCHKLSPLGNMTPPK